MRKFRVGFVEKLIREGRTKNLIYQMESEQRAKVSLFNIEGAGYMERKEKQRKHQGDN